MKPGTRSLGRVNPRAGLITIIAGVKTLLLLKRVVTPAITAKGVWFTSSLARGISQPPMFIGVITPIIILLKIELSGARSSLTFPVTFPPMPLLIARDKDPRDKLL